MTNSVLWHLPKAVVTTICEYFEKFLKPDGIVSLNLKKTAKWMGISKYVLKMVVRVLL